MSQNIVLIVMGVSSSGKTTVAKALAEKHGWPFEEGDTLHPDPNVEKMSRGVPLTDSDRWPWLDKVAEWIDAQRRSGQSGVITCSLLKRAYRDKVIGDKPDVRLMFLDGDHDLLAKRMARRVGHFMPTSLLDSQFATLEVPVPEERPIVVEVEGTIDEMVADAERKLEAALE